MPAEQPRTGSSFPLGGVVVAGGANFSVFARGATGVQLALFDELEQVRPSRVIDLEARTHRSGGYWHVFVPGLGPGQLYGYRVRGPFVPERGQRFDPDKLLVDPYTRCVAKPALVSRTAASRPGDNTATAFRSVLVGPSSYDWQADRRPGTPFRNTIIYEMHVGNFTRHPNSGVQAPRRGTFAGVIEKIPYLLTLGVTAVELLPVFAFDEQAAPPPRRNVWGYQPIALFAPHPSYGSGSEPLGVLDEFRDMVKALHRVGIEIILDVVFNHTAEGDASGPTLSFRGLGNDTYYIVNERGDYEDFSGTGNSLNAQEAVVRRLVLDSLRYWAWEMHIDGFRFDLAAAMLRDGRGRPTASAAVLRDIESDPALADVKLIAEPWDAAGLYRAGQFAAQGWREWNGQFRDDVRRFMKADERTVRALAARLAGSPDLYGSQRCEPPSINFVTCHDGFTLHDLVAYDRKHNEANGEANRDGTDDNLSWNCGEEGPTSDALINRLRERQAKNFLTITLLAAGTPMLLMGDEVLRSQSGNNNAYCLDGEQAWFDWSALLTRAGMLRFTQQLIALRRQQVDSATDAAVSAPLTGPRIVWHGVKLNEPDWGEASHSLAATWRWLGGSAEAHVVINAYWEPLEFALPSIEPGGSRWRRCVDTFLPSPQDIIDWRQAPIVEDTELLVAPRAVVVLIAARPEAAAAAAQSR